ncbi:hypothetical protein JTE90_010880 [Oedothorax gibbosus]|uniref:Lipase domain-containing protein n=1 Tax=Oedothorax gibbosus TaxID=931172 RepID=A0AAV6U166_9ARAC|nr:hypothetical protein JTE90_010880 [Oedothorax gibbosus]
MKKIKLFELFVVGGVILTQVKGQGILGLIGSLVGTITDDVYSLGSVVSSLCLSPPFEADGCEGTDEGTTEAFLFTRRNSRSPEFLHLCDWSLPNNTNFDPRDRTEIFVHGWLDGVCRSEWMREMKEELLKRGSFNVILIDWTWGNGLEYNTGAKNVYVVRKHLATLIQNIMRKSGVGAENFHLVGHSFGGQIVGLAGKIVPNLRRITGETLGDIQPLGDADFYPNGGREQESCKTNIIPSLLKLDVPYAAFLLLPEFCSHLQSIQYYKASINPTECLFIGVQCPDYASFESGLCNSCGRNNARCAVMGMDYEYEPHPAPRKRRPRKYYLDTTLNYPYCKRDN